MTERPTILEVDRVHRGKRTMLLYTAVILPGWSYEEPPGIRGPYRVTYRKGRKILSRFMVRE